MVDFLIRRVHGAGPERRLLRLDLEGTVETAVLVFVVFVARAVRAPRRSGREGRAALLVRRHSQGVQGLLLLEHRLQVERRVFRGRAVLVLLRDEVPHAAAVVLRIVLRPLVLRLLLDLEGAPGLLVGDVLHVPGDVDSAEFVGAQSRAQSQQRRGHLGVAELYHRVELVEHPCQNPLGEPHVLLRVLRLALSIVRVVYRLQHEVERVGDLH
mmetsp:Transcript_25888/g.61555  ORF Transcript_25888/g.61555 Transcript_25888/m.61555 type:complete len:212 (-) Transcript_25888:427-1062(-)